VKPPAAFNNGAVPKLPAAGSNRRHRSDLR
jgi:hypothetical protein